MKRILLILACLIGAATGNQLKAQDLSKSYGDFYQISIYHTAGQSQLDSLSNYLQNEYLPELHKKGFTTIGVFLPIANDTSADKRIIMWIPLKSLKQVLEIAPNIDAPKYLRRENIITSAFEKAPHYQMPHLNGPRGERVFELRSYEGPTEERYISKVKMFNAGGEVPLFARLNFNAVFFSNVVIGSRMPNLMYMISFDNMTAHDQHWKAFGEDPAWKTLSGLPEYQKNVSHIDSFLMHPASYSDVY